MSDTSDAASAKSAHSPANGPKGLLSSIYVQVRPSRAAQRGFAIAPILYMLGLIGIGAGILFSGYSQILRSNKQVTDDMTAKADVQAAGTTLSASSVLSADTSTLCPPQGGGASQSCANAPVKMVPLATAAADATASQLPVNYKTVGASGNPAETGVFAPGAGVKQLDPYGHFYIYCRWENPRSNPGAAAFTIISAGPDGTLQTKCGDTVAQGDDVISQVSVGTAIERSAVWETSTDANGNATDVHFGQVGTQMKVDATGNVVVPGSLTVGGTSTLGNVTAGSLGAGVATLSALTVSGTSNLNFVTASNANLSGGLTVGGSSSLGNLTATNGSFSGSLSAVGASTLGTLTAGTTTLQSASITGNASVGGQFAAASNASIGGTLGVTGDTNLGGALGVVGSTSLGGSLGVSGSTTLADVQAGTATLGSTTASSLGVTGATTGSSATYSGTVTASAFVGSGAGLTNLSAANLTGGVLPIANGGTGASTAAGALANLGGNNASNLTTGTLSSALLPTIETAGSFNWGDVDQYGRVTNGVNVVSSGLSDGAGDSITATSSGGNGALNFFTNGTQQAILDKNGNLGLGTLTPAQRLDLVGNERIEGAAGTDRQIQFTTGATSERWVIETNGTAEGGSNTGSDFVIQNYTDAGTPIATPALTIQRSTGNATFGGTITGNGSGLTNIPASSITGSVTASVNIGTALNATNPQISGDATSGLYTPSAAAIGMVTGGTERMRWDNAGKVGIGVVPAHTLDVAGDVNIGSTHAYMVGGANGLSFPPDSVTTNGSVAIGSGALASQVSATGGANVAVGDGALHASTSTGNTAVGYSALTGVTTGNNNTALGASALIVTSGSENTGIGVNAGATIAAGSENTALGADVLGENGNGAPTGDTGVGAESLPADSNVGPNTALGYFAMHPSILDTGSSVSGVDNIAIGAYSMVAPDDTNMSGNFNVAVGDDAMNGSITTASNNTGIGDNALLALSTGSNNVGIGGDAGSAIVAGSNNVALGPSVGFTNLGVSGNNNILIGTDTSTDAPTSATSNWLNIGNAIYGVNLRNATNTTGVPLVGIGIGLTSVTAGAVLDLSSNSTSANSSLLMPVGTTAARPTTGVNGMLRYNSTSGKFEGFQQNAWQDILTNGGSGSTIFLGTSTAATNPSRNGELGTGFYTAGSGLVDVAVSEAGTGTQVGEWSSTGLNLTGAAEGLKINGINAIRFPTSDTTAGGSIAIGSSALAGQIASAAYGNTAIGYQAIKVATSGTHNTAMGYQALTGAATSSNETAIGNGALSFDTGGTGNTAVGSCAGCGIITSDSNVAIGNGTLGNTNSPAGPTGETAVGFSALDQDSSTGPNTAIGLRAADLGANGNDLTGKENVAVGAYSMGYNQGNIMSGDFNVAVGDDALSNIGAGANNTALGDNAMQALTGGSNNVSVGGDAGSAIVAGSNNVAVGPSVGFTNLGVTGNNNILIGTDTSTDAPTSATSNWLNIGNAIYGTNLRNGTNTTGVPLIGIGIGLTTVTAGAVLDLSSNTTSANSSLLLPVGTSAARPGTGVNGMIRYNNSINAAEGFINGVWTPFATASGLGSITLGTSVTAENPSISGDATSGFYTPAASTVAVGAGGVEVMQWNTIASGADYVTVTPAIANSAPIISVAGSTNEGLNLTPAGTGAVNITTPTTGLQLGGVNGLRFPTDANGVSASIAIGSSALSGQTVGTGFENVAIGYQAAVGTMTSTAAGDVAIGYGALNTGGTLSGGDDIGIGHLALSPPGSLTGSDNVAIGNQAITSGGTISGNGNIGIGAMVMSAITSGSNNIGLGVDALENNNTGAGNVAVGSNSLSAVNSGGGNVAVGSNSLSAVNSGGGNVAFGQNVGTTITTGSNNTLLGAGAPALKTGNNDILIGTDASTDAPTNSTSNWLNIGNAIYGTNLYNSTNTTGVPLIGIGANLTSVTAGAVLDLSSNTTSANSSLLMPVGTTGARPTGVNGMIRYNITSGKFEGFQQNAWQDILTNGGSGGLGVDLGTSLTAENPQISGDATSGFYTPAASTVAVGAGGVEVEQWNTIASGVDYITITPAVANSAPIIGVAGSTNAGLNLTPAGTGGVTVTSGATTGTGLTVMDNAVTTGNVASVSSTSTAGAASGSDAVLNLSRSGVNANTAHTAYGLYSTVTNTNATSGTNVAGYFSASGATTGNYGLVVASGNVGIGTTTPAEPLEVLSSGNVAGIRVADSAAANAQYIDINQGDLSYQAIQAYGAKPLLIANESTNSGSQNGGIIIAANGGGTHALDINESGNIIVNSGGTTTNTIVTAVNPLDVSGAVAIGTSYAGAHAAPTNGLIVQGTVGIGTSSLAAGTALDLSNNTTSSNSSLLLPVGTTAARPGTGINGMIRYNSTLNAAEGFINGVWSSFLTSASLASSTINLGTSLTAENPQISGDATSGFYTPAASTVAVGASGVEVEQWNTIASGVDYITITPAVANGAPIIGVAGSTNESLNLTPAGTGAVNITSADPGLQLGGINGIRFPSSDSTAGGSIAIGSSALSGQTSSAAYGNVAIGYQAMDGVMTAAAVKNTGVGYQVLVAVTSGDSNTALGYGAASSITSGDNNTVLGYGVAGGTLTTGSSDILIGTDGSTTPPTASTSNWLNIGNAIYGYNLKNNSNGGGVPQIAIGTGITSVTAGAVLDLSSNTTSNNSSLLLPVGTSAARPGTGVNGMIRYNSTLNAAEGFVDGAWSSFLTSASLASSTINLGTSLTAENPQISGDATSGFYTPAASTVAVGAGGVEVMQWNTVASGVDYVTVTPAIANGAPIIGVAGSANEGLNLTPAGTGAVNITTANTGLQIAGINAISFPTGDSTAGASIAIGSSALSGQTSSAAYQNTAIGYQAMNGTMTTAAVANTAVGYQALNADTTGNSNLASGAYALLHNTTGIQNTGVGFGALTNNAAGNNNTAVGYQALDGTSVGNNTAVGNKALYTDSTGTNNTALGFNVGSVTLSTGSQNILIGVDASTDTPTASTSNWLNIGNAIYGTNLYNSTNTTGVPLIGIGANLTSVTAGAVLDLSSNTTAANSSLLMPVGTTAARPTGVNGMIRYNSTNGKFEGFQQNAWQDILTSGGSGGLGVNLGTSLTAENPQISGDATSGFYTPAASTVAVGAGGVEVMQWNTVASGVDYVTVTPAIANGAPIIGVAGSANEGLNLTPAGTGAVNITTANTGLQVAATNAIRFPTSDNEAASSSIAIGSSALAGQTSAAAYENVAIGYQAMAGTMTTAAIQNTAVGYAALTNDTSGTFNTAVGTNALYFNTSGGSNIAMGGAALYLNSSGGNNNAFGFYALSHNTTGVGSNAFGYYSLTNATGNYNTGFGDHVLQTVGAGANNTALGAYAGGSVTTGGNNTVLGYTVANTTLTTGSNDILIGTDSTTDAPTASTSNWLNIGNAIYGYNLKNTTNSSGVPQIAIGTGITSVTAGAVLDLSSNTTSANSSLLLPVGTSAARPGTGVNGMIRYNASTNNAEGFIDGSWQSFATSTSAGTINLGTSLTAENPSISGDATSGFYTPAASTVAVGAGGVEVEQWNTVASGVDYVTVTPAIANGAPIIGVAGSTNEGLNLTAKGTGAVNITQANTGLQIAGANAISFPTSDSGGASIAIGSSALSGQTSSAAYSNTAVGFQAMSLTMTSAATLNTAVGYQALGPVSSATSNTAIGFNALGSDTTGSYNNAVGEALFSNQSGAGNNAVGYYALASDIAGNGNNAFGYYALQQATGANNSAFGDHALTATTGGSNSGFGISAGSSVTTGSNNLALGSLVASTTLTTGSQDILIGTDASTDAPTASTSNWLNIGNAIYGYNLKNSTNSGGVPQIAIGTGITSVTAGAVLDLSSNTTSANSSLLLPVGTTAARPGTGVNGMIRYNNTTNAAEGFINGAWTAFATAAGAASINLGTSLTAENPSISGDATSGFYTPAASTVAVGAGGVEVEQWNTIASGVDYITITPAIANGAPIIAVAGSTNEGLNLTPAGTGAVNITAANTGLQINGANAVRFPTSDSGSASSSIAIGSSALSGQTVSAAYSNIAIGYQSMDGTMTTAAIQNTAVGYKALNADTSGGGNTALGYETGLLVTSGASNTIVGSTVGSTTLTTGTKNILIGVSANTDTATAASTDAIAIGDSAKAGSQDVAIGYQALNASTSDNNDNTAVGYTAGAANTSGAENTAIGYEALSKNTTGTVNTAVGAVALYNNVGNGDTAIGYQALFSNTSGFNNTAVGRQALDLSATGNANSAFGYQVGSTTLTSGGSNILIGTDNTTDVPTASTSNWLNIGNAIYGYNLKNSTNSGGVPQIAIGTGITSVTAGAVLDLSSNTTSANSSLLLPVGTTAARPGTGVNGMIRYNNTTNAAEGFINGAWTAFATAAGAASINLGTSLTAENPSISGDATSGFYTPAASTVAVGAGGVEVEQWNTIASGVDYITITPAIANGAPIIAVAGSTNEGLNLTPAGTGAVNITAANTGLQINGANAVRFPTSDSGSASSSIAIGSSALVGQTSSHIYSNVAIGYQAMSSTMTTAAGDNSAVGYQALQSVTSGAQNTALGYSAGAAITTNNYNVAVGTNAMSSDDSSQNVAIGESALEYGNGGGSVAVGQNSLVFATGGNNTGVGAGTGYSLSTGSNNAVFGANVGSTTLATGSQDILIGADNTTDVPTSSTSNWLNIGNAIYGTNLYNSTNTGGVPLIGIGANLTSVTAGAVLDLSSNTTSANSSLLMPVGTTAARPTGVNGMIRYNSTNGKFEGFQQNAWQDILTSGGSGGLGVNLGTSLTAENPQISGDATSGFYTPGADQVAVGVGGVEVMQWNTVASGVDYVTVTPAIANGAPIIGVAGSTNAGLNLTPAGTGAVNITAANTGLQIAATNAIRFPTSDSGAAQSIAIGSSALSGQSTSAAYANTAIGYQTIGSGTLTTAATNNTAVGFQALQNNTSGGYNAAFGSKALNSNTTGVDNVAFGANALDINSSGNENVAIGEGVMLASQTGSFNVAVGKNALFNSTSDSNTAVGYSGGYAISTGQSNLILGATVASTTLATGSNNILLGTDSTTDAPAAGTNNWLNIGNAIYGYNLKNGTNTTGVPQIGIGAGLTSLTAGAVLDLSSNTTSANSSLLLPVGTTAARPGTGVNGMVRYSTSANAVEGFINGSWQSLATSASAGTINLGTSLTAENPSISGDASSGFYTPGANTIAVGAGGVEVMQWNTVASGVDYVTVTPAIANGAPIIGVAGSTNAGLNLTPAGTGAVNITTANTGLQLGGLNAIRFPTSDTTAGGSIAIGSSALSGQTASAAYGNIGIGNQVMANGTLTTAALYNTAVGSGAIGHLTSGTGNTALGYAALAFDTSGSGNIALGRNTLWTTTTGSGNVAIGNTVASTTLQTGSNNILIGVSANTDTGTAASVDAIAIGDSAKAGTADVAIGYQALQATAQDNGGNTAIGYQALSSSGMTTAAVRNTGVGLSVLASDTSGSLNAALGEAALYSNTTGGSNTAIGQGALLANTTGGGNTALGELALQTVTTNGSNTGIGQAALYSNTGSANTALGDNSGGSITSGANNTAVGYHVSSTTLTTGGGNILIGTDNSTDTPTAATNNWMNIGNAIYGYNLYSAAHSSGVPQIGIGANLTSVTAGTVLDLSSNTTSANSSLLLPVGTTAARPGTGVNGMIRYNNTTNAAEGFINGSWQSFATSASAGTINLGTSLTAENPSISGDATSGFYTPGASTVAVGAGGVEVEQWNTLASAVDYLSITPAIANGAPIIGVAGSTNESLNLTPAGTGNIGITTGDLVFGSTTTPSYTVSMMGTAAQTIGMERHTTANTAGNTLTINAGGATSGATNKSGGNLVLSSGISTGTGSSAITFQPVAAGSTGTGNDNPAEVARFTSAGLAIGTTSLQAGNQIEVDNATPIIAAVSTSATSYGQITVIASDGHQAGLTSVGPSWSIGTTADNQALYADNNLYIYAGAAGGGGKKINFVTNDGSLTNDPTSYIRMTVADGGVSIGTTALTTGVSLDLSATTNSMLLPVGTSAARPGTGVNGMIRYNSTLNAAEGFINGAWASFATSGATTLNLGTSLTAENPQISGDATSGFYTPAASTVAVGAGGKEVEQWNTLTSAVDYLSITPAIANGAPIIGVAGSTNESLNLTPAGTGAVNITTANTGLQVGGVPAIRFPTSDNEAASSSIAIGSSALVGQTSAAAYENVAIGYQAMSGTMTTAAIQNTAVGYQALQAATTGTSNVAIGNNALGDATQGSYNVAVGSNAANFIAVGAVGTIAIGQVAMEYGGGSGSIVIGANAGIHTAGNSNVVIGASAGGPLSSGNNDTILGGNVANTTLTTGSQDILIGVDASTDAPTSSTSNWMNIGNAIYGYNFKNSTNTTGVPQIAIGTGITSLTAGAVLDLSSNTTSTNSSLLLPVGTTAARPTGTNGMIRYNSTLNNVEGFINGAWTNMSGSSSSSNLGTSTSAASPQISGDATSGFYTPGASTVAVTAGGKEVEQWNTLASAVDYLSITPAIANGAPIIGVAGSTNESLNLTPAGTGAVNITTANTGLQVGGVPAIRFPTSDNEAASSSIAIGSSALVGQTSAAAYENVAIGYQSMAGTMTTAAIQNTAVGYAALANDTSGTFNVAVGTNTLNMNTSGSGNIAVGGAALYFNSSGSNNNAFGYEALAHNTTSTGSNAFGYYALTNSTGAANTAFGDHTLQLVGSGTNNSALGEYAGGSVTTGGSNTILGAAVASTTLTTGSSNILIGVSANTTTEAAASTDALAIGDSAKAGSKDIAIGYQTLKAITADGSENTAIGYQAGDKVTSGTNNTILGGNVASTTLTTGSLNILIGTGSTVDTPTASASNWLNIGNTIYGTLNTNQIAIGNGVTSVTTGAALDLSNNTTTANSTLLLPIGTSAARPSTGVNGMIRYNSTLNTMEGYVNGVWASFSTGGGGGGTPSGSDTQVQFNQSGAFGASSNLVFNYGSGYLGINKSSPAAALDVVGSIQFTGTINEASDMRLKKNIVPLSADDMLDRMAKINTYSFVMKNDPKQQTNMGVMAQELEKVFPELVETNNDSMHTKYVNYIGLIAPMIEADKKLKTENDELKGRVTQLEDEITRIDATLAKSAAPAAPLAVDPLAAKRPVDMQVSATASVPVGFIITAPEDAVCTLQYEGALRYSVPHKALMLCDGKQWNIVKTEPAKAP